jgi:purine-nucleoside phosphorylase
MSVHTVARSLFQDAVRYIREQTRCQPVVGIILGSGLSSLASDVRQPVVIPYPSIPHFAVSTVQGHTGQLVLGELEGHSVVVMQGRLHFYEGYSMQQVTFPVRVIRLLGAETLIVTNASGGLNPLWQPGDLMLISDHLNLVGMVGSNPLIGPNDDDLGPRFPDMSQAYDPRLREIARQVAASEGLPLREGVYACLAGPSFETPAEVRFLRTIGADAVGMSTAPEVTIARHMGMHVLGVAGISNVHAGDRSSPRQTTHQEVLDASKVIAPRLGALVRGVLKQL